MDPTNGFTAIHRAALAQLPLDKIDRGYFFESDMLFRLYTIRAVVRDVPMPARYGGEPSSLRVGRVAPRSSPRSTPASMVKRLFYSYFLRDFNAGTLQFCLGLVIALAGVAIGVALLDAFGGGGRAHDVGPGDARGAADPRRRAAPDRRAQLRHRDVPREPLQRAAASAARMSLRSCVVCGLPMRGPTGGFRYDCPACGYACADLPVAIAQVQGALREDDREAAIAPLRRRNFETVLDRLDVAAAASSRVLLEVGCAHGWFLDAARRRGYVVQGIEPDAPIGAQAALRGHPVAIGYFPAALGPHERYDVIAFNDVFEHLPDPRAALREAHARLRPGGRTRDQPAEQPRGTVSGRARVARTRLARTARPSVAGRLPVPAPVLLPSGRAGAARPCKPVSWNRRACRCRRCSRTGLWERLRYDTRASWPARASPGSRCRSACRCCAACPRTSCSSCFAARMRRRLSAAPTAAPRAPPPPRRAARPPTR